MKSPLIAALMAASALTALPAVALAGETTIIHEKTVLMPSQPAPAPAVETQTQTQTRQTTAVRRVAVRHATRHRAASFHHIVRHSTPAHAVSATSAATQTSATVRQDTTQAQAPQPQADPAPQVVEDRRTVIHRNDDGDVERHTRIIRQGPNGMTSIEHHSSEGPADAP